MTVSRFRPGAAGSYAPALAVGCNAWFATHDLGMFDTPSAQLSLPRRYESWFSQSER